MASSELEFVISMLRSAPVFAEGGIAAQRQHMEAITTSVPLPDDVRLTPVDAGGVPAEWVEIGSPVAGQAIVYCHGGAYNIGSVRTHRVLVANIARAAGTRVLSVDYRLAPEHPYPAAVEDAECAYRYVLAQGIAADRIGLAGDSAGGGLVVAALLALRDAGAPLPGAVACISPWLDLTLSGETMTTKAAVDPMIQRERLEPMAASYAAGLDRRTPGLSPLFGDLTGLPEFLIHVGTAETLLDDSLRFVAKLRQAGGDVSIDAYPDMIHVWHAFAMILPEARDAIERLGAFFASRLAA